jgi:hypothetical protein
MNIRFNDVAACRPNLGMQEMIDAITPYMSPHRRPLLQWQLPRSYQYRAAIVRGVNWGWTLEGPRAQGISPQWVVPSGEVFQGTPPGGGSAEQCVVIKPSSDTEAGRTYNLVFPRVYPPSLPLGGRVIHNYGSADAHWVLTMFGPVINPKFTINGVLFAVDRRGGVNIAAGQTLVVNTRARTVLLNGLANASRYQYCNYEEWGWDDLMLHPGNNTVRFEGTNMTTASAAELCYTPTYM